MLCTGAPSVFLSLAHSPEISFNLNCIKFIKLLNEPWALFDLCGGLSWIVAEGNLNCLQYTHFWAFPSGLSTVSHYVNVINNLVERVNVFLSRRESKGSLHLSRKCTSQMLVLKAPQGMGGEILLSLHNSKNLGGSEPTAQTLPFPFNQGHSKRKKKQNTSNFIFLTIQFLLSSIYFPCHILAHFL